jgi:hypothetical protein
MISAAVNEPNPFMSMEMDAARYYDFIAQTMQMKKDGDDDEEDEAAAEFKAAVGETMVVVGDMFSRMSFQVYFTEHGVEFPSTMELAE